MVDLATVSQTIAEHPQEILIWTNGFFCALALRRGRIEALFSKVLPVPSSDSEKGGD